MERRRLGKTGLEVTRIAMGGIPLMRLTKAEAERVVRAALDEGINFIETARGYQDSEEKVGAAIKGRNRDEFFICSKSNAPDADGILKKVDQSLEALGVDYIDIYQIHGILKKEQLERALAPGGVLEGLKRAQEQGKIRHIGVTGHKQDALIEAIKTGEFSNVQLPFNFVEREPLQGLIPLCKEMDVGVIVMKPLGGGVFERADLALRWLLEQPVETISVGMQSVEEVKQNVKLAEEFEPLGDEERRILERDAEVLGKQFCRFCEYCQPCPAGIRISSVIMIEMFIRRNGMEALLEWNAEEWLDKVDECQDCGQCEERCPYELPVRELIRDRARRFKPVLAEARAKLRAEA